MRLQKISIFYLVAFFALLPSIGNILSGENSLDLYDSKARFYDSMIGRTTSQDPLAEKYYHLSPYLWCAANPIKFGDKNGMYLKGIDGNPVFFDKKILEFFTLTIKKRKCIEMKSLPYIVIVYMLAQSSCTPKLLKEYAGSPRPFTKKIQQN